MLSSCFNVNVLDISKYRASQFLDISKSFELTQIISDLIRVTDISMSLIDLIFTNKENCISSGVLSDNVIANHFIIYFTIRCKGMLFSKYKKLLETTPVSIIIYLNTIYKVSRNL